MFRRTHNEANKTKFLFNLQLTDWEVIMNETTIDTMYSAFINKFSAIYDQSFPLIKVNNKCRTLPRKPWLTPGLANCCHKKEKLYTKFIKKPTDKNKQKYIKYRNKLNSILKNRKIILERTV